VPPENEPEGRAAPEPDRIWGQDEILILGKGRKREDPLPIAEAGGIEARMAIHDGALIYELKVPLKGGGDRGLAVGADPGQSLRVAIETAPFQGPSMGYSVRRGPAIGVTMGGRGGGIGVSTRSVRGSSSRRLDHDDRTACDVAERVGAGSVSV
jgi:hypothetical protein